MSWLAGFETHTGTITGERQTGTEDDGFGGTQPIYEDVLLFDGWLRYEPNGAGLARDFQGESSEDEPVVFIDGQDATESVDVLPDEPSGVVFEETDTLTIDGFDGTFEITNIEAHSLSGDIDFVLLNPVSV